MEMRRWSWWWLRLIVAVAAVSKRWHVVNSDPQSNRLYEGECSSIPAKNASEFNNNLNAIFSDLRSQLSSAEDKRYATADRSPSSSSNDEVYAMVQCRNYMSQTDCLGCYDDMHSNILNCSNKNATGGREASDGCFLRFESYSFYALWLNSWVICDDNSSTVAETGLFSQVVERLLSDLKDATPRIKNEYFAASKRKVDNTITVYAAAQCGLNVTEDGCLACLTTALQGLKEECLYSLFVRNRGGGRVVDAACFMRYSKSSFFLDNQTTDIDRFLKLPGGMNEKALIGGTVGGAALVVIVVTTFIWYKFSRQLKIALIGNILGATELQHPNTYSYKDLKKATNNFSEENKLGSGGFGAVYKARLRNESVVAVKKLDMRYSRVKEDFEGEVRLISNVHHRNLVRLLGCCRKGSDLLLIYEYMENGSLDTFLYGKKRGILRWKQRVDIIFGTARGLAYLHELYHTAIIHRDIKPGNILLDNQFQPKIADFGLARLLPHNQTHLSTGFAGTLGYTAPEYALHGHLSEKVDIYSFGIVILEIISGRKCSDIEPDSTSDYLLKEAWKLYERGSHENLADEALESDEYEVEELKKMVEIGMMCVQETPSSRPTMSQLIYMLSTSTDGSMGLQRPLIPRPSFNYDENNNEFLPNNQNQNASLPTAASHATASITHFTGR